MLAVALTAGGADTLAQVRGGLPGEVGRQDRPALDRSPMPRAIPPAAIPGGPGAQPTDSASPSFVLKDVIIEGATVYSADELRGELDKLLGQTLTVEQLPELEEAVARRYRRDGYILARALVPADQELDPAAAVVKLVVYEGYIGRVRLDPLEYEVGERGDLLRATLKKIEGACRSGDEPKDAKPCPIHQSVLERYLLLANDLPGVKASAVIQPSADAAGGADLFVTVTEKPYSASAKIDNRGSVYVGPFRGDVGGSLNNLTDFYERSSVRVIAAKPIDELLLLDIAEEVPVTTEGTRASFSYTRSQSKPGDILRRAAINSKTEGGAINLVHPLLRSRSENLFLRSAFDYRNSTTDTAGGRLFNDRTRDVSFGATYDLADRFLGVNLVDLRWTAGLPIMHYTRSSELPPSAASRAGASANFYKVTAEASRLQRLFPEVNLLTAVNGQYAFDNTLVVSEQFGYGGERYGRGFDASEVLGDHGLAMKGELQYSPGWVGDVLAWAELPSDVLRAVQFYAYYDFGIVWQRPSEASLLAAASVSKDRDTGASAGIGMRFSLTDWLSGYVEVAQPLTRALQAQRAKGDDEKPTRYFFSLATQF